MRICFETRTVTLSIGEFSDFTDTPVAPSARQGGLWRARIGQAWHGELQKKASAEAAHRAAFEVPVNATWDRDGWRFVFQGRADQIIEEQDGIRIREVKTVTSPLPADESRLRADYPAYFIQLSTYLALYPLTRETPPARLDGELLFVEIQSGIVQPVAMAPGDDPWFSNQIERLLRFLEHRRRHLENLRAIAFNKPFETLRAGQETVRDEIEKKFRGCRVGLFEAPTGFGKTGIVLEYALNELKRGEVDRIVYLTSKGTGQIQASAQLGRMLGDQATAPFFQMRSKSEHCIHSQFHCFRETCPFLDDMETRWTESGMARHLTGRGNGELFEIESIKDLGRQAGVCPFEITRSFLPFFDIWLADYNYVFSPAHRNFFFNQPGFDPDRTLLVVDEAHNLPSRAADCLSSTVSLQDAVAAMTELELTAAPNRLLTSWEAWVDFLSHLAPADELPLFQLEELRITIERLIESLQEAPPAYVDLSPSTLDRIGDLYSLAQSLEDDELETLAWSPAKGELRLTCLDAGPLLRDTLKHFPKAVLMSATFGPPDDFLHACRIEPEESELLSVEAPWRKAAYEVAADVRPDTRYKRRKDFLPMTADTTAKLVAAGGPVVVFFPSYRYAEDVRQQLDWSHPEIRVALQERGLSLADQTAFIEESLVLADALFLILGGSFAEGIDLLGGRVRQTMVVGPALPEVNAPRRVRMDRLERKFARDEAFRLTYQVPALQKVNQALGRLVRAPGQRTRVLLHCRRFAEKSYASLLHPDLQPTSYLLDDGEVDQWIHELPERAK